MRNPESSFFRDMQENTHRENEKKAKTLERAKAFEHIFQISVAQGHWLNNPEEVVARYVIFIKEKYSKWQSN